jgi:hypothetical protein
MIVTNLWLNCNKFACEVVLEVVPTVEFAHRGVKCYNLAHRPPGLDPDFPNGSTGDTPALN